jgi:hypothetical protein
MVDSCVVPSYIDDVRYYNRELKNYEISAEAAPALGGVEPYFLHLGCIDCDLKSASESCIDGYHICTNVEIYSEVY